MKKLLSGILMSAIAFSSLSAACCFANESDTVATLTVESVNVQTTTEKEPQSQTKSSLKSEIEMLSSKLKKIADYTAALSTLGACAYLAYNHGQDITKYVKEIYTNYMLSAKTLISKKTTASLNDITSIVNRIYEYFYPSKKVVEPIINANTNNYSFLYKNIVETLSTTPTNLFNSVSALFR